MNVDRILETLNRHQVAYLLIGGMNFLLRHQPVLTFDIDFWIADNPTNRRRCERALTDLDAEWGRDDEDWKPVRQHPHGWLESQPLFCLTSPHGAIDIFRSVAGLGSWDDSHSTSEFKADEESRRDRHWDPSVRWRVLQETIQWAEAQAAVRRNTKARRLEEQQQKLARLGNGA